MSKTGLVRIPYYPQLNVLSDNKASALSLTLSVLLYWSSRSQTALFSKKEHAYQLSVHLNLAYDEVINSLDMLRDMRILDETTLCRAEVKKIRKGENATITENDYKKTIDFLKVNYKNLSLALNEKGIYFSDKTLRHASDDSFDFYDVIVPSLLPSEQILEGTLTGDDFDRAALLCAQIACFCVHKDDEFSYKAVAPGWRILLQKPSAPEDIASRWCCEEQRAVDLSFSDGNLFLIDSKNTGAKEHTVRHYGRNTQSRILACACLLGIASVFDHTCFKSDIDITLVADAVIFLYRATGIKAVFDENFFLYRAMTGEDEAAARALLQKYIDEL